jgi:hypothetical protein
MVINKVLLKPLLILLQQPGVGFLIIALPYEFQTIVAACIFLTEINVWNENLECLNMPIIFIRICNNEENSRGCVSIHLAVLFGFTPRTANKTTVILTYSFLRS